MKNTKKRLKNQSKIVKPSFTGTNITNYFVKICTTFEGHNFIPG